MQRKFESHGCRFNRQWFDQYGNECDIPGIDHQLMHPIIGPDGSYVGDAKIGGDFIRLLARRGIFAPMRASPAHNVASIGKSELDGKWYGWSHRAMHGFGVGDSVKMGDCAYAPKNAKEWEKEEIAFWSDEHHLDTHIDRSETSRECLRDGEPVSMPGALVCWTYSDDIKNEKMRGQPGSLFCYHPDEWGRGEWTAQTDDDAKQMAIDFANGVS